MVDITICVNQECAINKYCYRYMALPCSHQSFARFEPYKEEDGWHCEHFMEILKKEL